MAGYFEYNELTVFTLDCISFQPKPTRKYVGINANLKAVSLTVSCLITLILIYSLYFCNSADYILSSALFPIIDNIKGGYWYYYYIKTTYPNAVLPIDVYFEI